MNEPIEEHFDRTLITAMEEEQKKFEPLVNILTDQMINDYIENQLKIHQPMAHLGNLIYERVGRTAINKAVKIHYDHHLYEMFRIGYEPRDKKLHAKLTKEIVDNSSEIFQMGLHFKQIIEAVQSDDFIKSSWEAFVIALRMREPPK